MMGVLVGANGFSFRIYVSFSYLAMFLSSSSRLIQIRGSPAQAWSGYIWRFFALFFLQKGKTATPCHAMQSMIDTMMFCLYALWLFMLLNERIVFEMRSRCRQM